MDGDNSTAYGWVYQIVAGYYDLEMKLLKVYRGLLPTVEHSESEATELEQANAAIQKHLTFWGDQALFDAIKNDDEAMTYVFPNGDSRPVKDLGQWLGADQFCKELTAKHEGLFVTLNVYHANSDTDQMISYENGELIEIVDAPDIDEPAHDPI